MVQFNFFDSNNIVNEVYESSLELYPSYDDDVYNRLYIDFKIILGIDIDRIIRIQSKYINNSYKQTVSRKLLKDFLNRIYITTHLLQPVADRITHQIFLAHLLTSFFRKYCIDKKYNITDYNSNIYIPSILLALSHFLDDARIFICNIINVTLKEVSNQSQQIINFYSILYNVDLDIMKSDLIYYFIEHVLPDSDPHIIINLNKHYTIIIKRIIYYYLKVRTSDIVDSKVDQLPNDIFELYDNRFNIYENGIYFYKLSRICSISRAYNTITKNYYNLAGSILTNDFQEIILSMFERSPIFKTKKQQLINSYVLTETSNELLFNWPIIYRILRSIKIKSNTSMFDSAQLARLDNCIFDELYLKIMLNKNLTKSIIIPIIKSISMRFSQSFNNCKFIDPINLETVYVDKDQFIIQITQFIKHILNKATYNES